MLSMEKNKSANCDEYENFHSQAEEHYIQLLDMIADPKCEIEKRKHFIKSIINARIHPVSNFQRHSHAAQYAAIDYLNKFIFKGNLKFEVEKQLIKTRYFKCDGTLYKVAFETIGSQHVDRKKEDREKYMEYKNNGYITVIISPIEYGLNGADYIIPCPSNRCPDYAKKDIIKYIVGIIDDVFCCNFKDYEIHKLVSEIFNYMKSNNRYDGKLFLIDEEIDALYLYAKEEKKYSII